MDYNNNDTEHLNLDDIASGAIDLGHNNCNGISNDDAKTIRECVETLRGSANMASDTIHALADILLEPDGRLKDLSDKKGRENLLNAITKCCNKLDEARDAMNRIPLSLEKTIPSSVKAELCDEDRKRIDKTRFRYSWSSIICITFGILTGFLFVITTYKTHELNDRKAQIEQYLEQQQEMIYFGNTMRNRYPQKFMFWEKARQEALEEKNK